MSGIAGVWLREGPVPARYVDRMLAAAANRGPDGSGSWSGRGVALGHLLLRETEESASERQPLTDGRGLWITADCRIDNREEIAAAAGPAGIGLELRGAPDAAYILAAYRLWGTGAPPRLLGDFAFALWDGPARRLFCARDVLGMKPFVYHEDGRRLIFGSDSKQILADPSVPRGVDLLHLTDIMRLSCPDRTGTPFSAVRRLPPGHALEASPRGLRISRYDFWNPETEPLSSASPQEHAERFGALFSGTVRDRLRLPRGSRVGVTLSGGLDSSSVLCEAARHGPAPDGYMLLFPGIDESARIRGCDPLDERRFALAAADAAGARLREVPISGGAPFEPVEENMLEQEAPLMFVNLPYFRRMYREAAGAGARVLLSGEGGDELFYPGPAAGRPFSARRWAGDWRRHLSPRTFPAWIDPAFARRHRLQARDRRELQFLDPRVRAARSFGLLCWLRVNRQALFVEAGARVADWNGVTVRSPFTDRRLMRFAAALPLREKAGSGVTKVLLRRAMRGTVPDPILERSSKAEFTPVKRDALRRHADLVEELCARPDPALKEALLPDQLRRAYDRHVGVDSPQADFRNAEALTYLWHAVAVDHWLKHREILFRTNQEVANGEPQAVPAR